MQTGCPPIKLMPSRMKKTGMSLPLHAGITNAPWKSNGLYPNKGLDMCD